jgi:outer membrane protein OmpA-like peptidoglycan-associated protein
LIAYEKHQPMLAAVAPIAEKPVEVVVAAAAAAAKTDVETPTTVSEVPTVTEKPAVSMPVLAELVSKAKEFLKSEKKVNEEAKAAPVAKFDAAEIKSELTKMDALGASAVLNVSPSAIEIEIPVRVTYLKGSASLKPQVREQLGKFARYVGALNPSSKFEVTYAGHEADQLTPDFRAQRADRVAAAIRDSGIQAVRIVSVQQVVLKDESPRDVASAGPNSSKSPHILVRVRTAD